MVNFSVFSKQDEFTLFDFMYMYLWFRMKTFNTQKVRAAFTFSANFLNHLHYFCSGETINFKPVYNKGSQ